MKEILIDLGAMMGVSIRPEDALRIKEILVSDPDEDNDLCLIIKFMDGEILKGYSYPDGDDNDVLLTANPFVEKL